MGTTLRVVEYSVGLWFAMSHIVEAVLQLSVGMEAWEAVPSWLGPTAFDMYVPVLIANVIVFYYSVSRGRFWVFCLTTKFVSLFLFIPIFLTFPSTGMYPSQHPVKALAFLTVWSVAVGLSYLFVTNDGYRRAYRRFEAYFRV